MMSMPVYIVSIHDETADGRALAVDLRHVVAALGDAVRGLRFCILDIEATGDAGTELHERMTAAPDHLLWVSATELVELAGRILQTIECQIAGFPVALEPGTVRPNDLNVARFPENGMAIVIAAIDSTSFEVYAKDPALTARVAAAFKNVRTEDPSMYFEFQPQ